MAKQIKVTRSYKLKVFGNSTKTDTARYTHAKFLEYANAWAGKLFFNGNKQLSTKGMGDVANQAQHKVRGILRAQKEAQKVTGNKTNVPYLKNISAYALLEKSKSKSKHFDYWIRTPNLWRCRKPIYLPLKSHKALNKALKNHWELSSHCEFKFINGEMFVYVFVSKMVEKATPSKKCLGADVGINKSVTFSDGYKGRPLGPAMDKAKRSEAERKRQQMKFGQVQKLKKNRGKTKTEVKQILDYEAKECVRRSRQSGSTVVVESRRILRNLRTGKLDRWARCYFAQRMEVLCKEESLFFLEVNPWMTSQICQKCGEKGSRKKEEFVCQNANCSEHLMKADADINAAKVLTSRGHRVLMEKIIPCWNNQDGVKNGGQVLKMKLNKRMRLFVMAYSGDEKEAARMAGYGGTDSALKTLGKKLLANPEILKAIAERDTYRKEVSTVIADRESRQEFWSNIMHNHDPDAHPTLDKMGNPLPPENIPMQSRLRASELLGKSEGDFVDKVEHSHNVSLTDLIEQSYDDDPAIEGECKEIESDGSGDEEEMELDENASIEDLL